MTNGVFVIVINNKESRYRCQSKHKSGCHKNTSAYTYHIAISVYAKDK